MRSRTGSLIVLAVLASAPVLAQDLEVFKFGDFVDPAILDGMSKGRGESLYYFASDIHLGYISDYQSRSTFSEEDAFFLRISNNLYLRDWQFGVKATSFGDRRDMVAIGNRLTLDVGYYFTDSIRIVEDDRQYVVDQASRVRFSWDSRYLLIEERVDAFSVDYDIKLDGPPDSVKTAVRNILGGYTYTWVEPTEVDGGHGQHYLSMRYRAPVRHFSNGARLFGGYGLGIERTLGHTRWGALRMEIGYEFPIPDSDNKLRIVYAPAYQLDRGHYDQEISILFNPPLMTALGRLPWGSASKSKDSR